MSVRAKLLIMIASWFWAAPLSVTGQQPAPLSQPMTAQSQAHQASPEKFRKAVAENLAGSKARAAVKVKNPNAEDKGLKPYNGKPQFQCIQNVIHCGNESCGS